MGWLARFWKRRVLGRPDRYQASISLPIGDGDAPDDGDVRARIDDLEAVFEGRLDVFAKRDGVTVVTDAVPRGQFETDAFDDVLDDLEALYEGTHSLAVLEKWRTLEERVVKRYVVVPVKPLFRTESEAPESDPEPTARAPGT